MNEPWHSNQHRSDLSPTEFMREYLATFIDEDEYDEENVLRHIAHRYFSRCEAYDRGLCQNERGIPRDGYELALINKHARTVIEELSHYYGYSTQTVFSAIQRYSLYFT